MLVLVTLPVLFSHGLFEHTIVFVSFESVKSPVSMALLQTLYERTVSWHIVLVLLKILQLAVLLHLYHTHNLS